MKVICNATPFIALASVKKLELLEVLFAQVDVPLAVIEELEMGGPVKD